MRLTTSQHFHAFKCLYGCRKKEIAFFFYTYRCHITEFVFIFQPMSMTRGSYRERREGHTDKAVVIRSFFMTSLFQCYC
jgi:hypothetical protein